MLKLKTELNDTIETLLVLQIRRPLYLLDKNQIQKLHKLWHRWRLRHVSRHVETYGGFHSHRGSPKLMVEMSWEIPSINGWYFSIVRNGWFFRGYPVMTGWKPPCLKTGWITGQVREIMVQTTAEAPVTMNTAVNQVRKKKRGETGKPSIHHHLAPVPRLSYLSWSLKKPRFR